MLSTFPELFTYALLAPFILRIVLGGFFIFQGIRRHKQDSQESTAWANFWGNKKIGSLSIAPILTKVQIVLGIFLFVGLYTQISAILAIVFVLVEAYKRNSNARLSFQEVWMLIFTIAMAKSLLFLGAGLLAFDLPL